jgi:lysophospholipase L1-like esterase
MTLSSACAGYGLGALTVCGADPIVATMEETFGARMSAARSRPRLRAIAPNVLLALGSVVLVSLATEVAFRLYFRETLSTGYLQEQLGRTWLGEFTRPSAQAELRYELKPGVDVNWGGIRVVTSGDGRRISPFRHDSVANPALKVAILGDSSAFGWGVEYDHTYGALLQQQLEQWLGRPVELRNFGVPGYNSQQERLCFEAHVLPWQPDLMVLDYDFNDADPIEGKPLNYIAADYGDNPLHSVAIKWYLRSRQQRRINRVMWLPEEDPQHPTKVYLHYRVAGPLYDQHLHELEIIGQEAARHHIRLIAFIFNTWLEPHADFEEDPFYTLLHQPMVRALQRYGFSVVDSYALCQQVMAVNGWNNLSPLWVRPDDGHPNALAHALIAQALFEHIITAGMVDGP